MSYIRAVQDFENAASLTARYAETPLDTARRLACRGPRASAWGWLLLPGLALLLGLGLLVPLLAVGYVVAAIIGSALGIHGGLVERHAA